MITSINMSTTGVMNAAAYLPEIIKAKMAAGLMFAMMRIRPRIDVQDETGLRNVRHLGL